MYGEDLGEWLWPGVTAQEESPGGEQGHQNLTCLHPLAKHLLGPGPCQDWEGADGLVTDQCVSRIYEGMVTAF